MQAVVFRGPGKVRVENVPEPKLKRGETMVQFRAGSICGTDLHFYRGEWTDLAVGKILGHDACGQVVESGERVAVIPKLFCGSCRYCMNGRPNLCERSEGFMGFDRDGLFSELIAATRRNLVPIPSNVSFEEAGILEPVALALHTFDLLSPRIGEYATILGQGPVGLLMTQVAKASGCRVIALDTEEYRLKMSEKCGADFRINPRSENATRRVKSITKGGSDIVVEAAGLRETVEQTQKLVRKAGRVALVGNFSGFMNLGEPEEAKFFSVVVNPMKYSKAAELLSTKVLDVKSLITHRFPLSEFKKAIETAADPSKRPMKVILSR